MLVAAQFRVAVGDASGGLTHHIASRLLSVFTEEETRLRHYIGVAPAIEDNTLDIAFGVEAILAEQFGQLAAYLQLVVGIIRAVEFPATFRCLGAGFHAEGGEGHVEGENGGFVRVQRRLVAGRLHGVPDVALIAKVTAVQAGGYAGFVHKTPVIQGHVGHQHGAVVELAVGIQVGFGHIAHYGLVDPAAAGHDHAPGQHPVKPVAACVGNRYQAFVCVLHPHHGGRQADANLVAVTVEGVGIKLARDDVVETVLASNGIRDQALEEVAGKTCVAAGEGVALADLEIADALETGQGDIHAGVGGNTICPQADAAGNQRVDILGDGAIQPQHLFQVVLVGHGVQPLVDFRRHLVRARGKPAVEVIPLAR